MDVVGAGLDIAVQHDEPSDIEFIIRHFGSAPVWLCATPYLDRRVRSAETADLEGYSCLRFHEGRPKERWPLEGPDSVLEAMVGRWLESDSSRALGDAVHACLGIGLRLSYDVDEASDLEHVLPDYTFARSPLVPLMPPDRHRLERVRAVLEALAKSVDPYVSRAP